MTHDPHDHVHPPAAPVAIPDDAIQTGAQQWLAREFVGGLIAMAQTHDVDVADFLAEKCVILSMRAASGEAERDILRVRLQALEAQNAELQQKVDDCPCHDENTDVVAANSTPAPPVGILPSNGVASA
jgi:hypothetical protein